MKTFPVIIIILLVFCSSLSAQVPDSLKYRSLSPEDFRNAYQKEPNAVLIDVREFFEFRSSRIKGAINIPSSGDPVSATDTIPKDNSLFLYCTTGFRSKRVARDLYDKGFLRLYSLEGGIVAWKKEGLPVSRKKVKRK
jgi:thioredoxin 1